MTLARLKTAVALILTLAMVPAPVVLATPGTSCLSGGCSGSGASTKAGDNVGAGKSCCGNCQSGSACKSASCCATATRDSLVAAPEKSCCAKGSSTDFPTCSKTTDAAQRQPAHTTPAGSLSCELTCALSNCGCQASAPIIPLSDNSESRGPVVAKTVLLFATARATSNDCSRSRLDQQTSLGLSARASGAALRIWLCSWTV